MDLSKIKELTDQQLISLYRNPSIDKEIKAKVLQEITLRDIEELKSKQPEKINLLTKSEKLRLVFLPFLYKSHMKAIIGKNWTRQKDKQFWNFITFGVAFYTLIALIALVLKNKF